MVDYVAGVLFIKTNYGRKRRFRPRAGRQSRATRKYRIMLEDPLGAARGRAGRPSHIRDKSASGMSGTRLQKRARAGAPEATLFCGFRTRRFPTSAGRSRPAARMRVRRARSGGGAGLEARSRLRGYPRVDQAVGGAIRCSSGPAATISLCAGGGLKGTLGKRI